ncbi:hypothetical protein C8F01DRAFT_1233524 [Mycena amicta]|nr:hypothetical protein C8F01DRAFT_1233524 [Mycena amicta]
MSYQYPTTNKQHYPAGQRLEPLRRADVDPTLNRQRTESTAHSSSRHRTESTTKSSSRAARSSSRPRVELTPTSRRAAPPAQHPPMPPMPPMPTMNYMQPIPPHQNSRGRTTSNVHPRSSGQRESQALRSSFDDDSEDEISSKKAQRAPLFDFLRSKKDKQPAAPSQPYRDANTSPQKALRRRSRSVGSFNIQSSSNNSHYIPDGQTGPGQLGGMYGMHSATRSTATLSPNQSPSGKGQTRSRLHLAVPPALHLKQSNGKTETNNSFRNCALTMSRDPNDPDLPGDYNHPWFYRTAQEAREAEIRHANEVRKRKALEALVEPPKRVNALPPDDVKPKQKRPEFFDEMFEKTIPLYSHLYYA